MLPGFDDEPEGGAVALAGGDGVVGSADPEGASDEGASEGEPGGSAGPVESVGPVAWTVCSGRSVAVPCPQAASPKASTASRMDGR